MHCGEEGEACIVAVFLKSRSEKLGNGLSKYSGRNQFKKVQMLEPP